MPTNLERPQEISLRRFVTGLEAGLADIAQNLNTEELATVLEELQKSIGSFNEALGDAGESLSDFNGDLTPAEQLINSLNGDLTGSEQALLALGNSAALAADTIADEFQINLADVLEFFNQLPEGTASSFAAIEENA